MREQTVYVYECSVCKERYTHRGRVSLSEPPWHNTESHSKQMVLIPELSTGTPVFESAKKGKKK